MTPVKLNQSVLRQECRPVNLGEIVRFKPLISGMFEIADGKKCIGLAANQVGRAVRIIVINCKGFQQALINPVVERAFGGVHAAIEGCMSFPNVEVRVLRPKRCRVSALDQDGGVISFAPKNNLICRAILHEIDHLNGITMFDRCRRPELPYNPEDSGDE